MSQARIRALNRRGGSGGKANTGPSSTKGGSCAYGTAKACASLLGCSLIPGRPFAALDLGRLGLPADTSTARAIASSNAGELLDDDARRAYRVRVAELGEQIEAAETEGKSDEAGLLREEMDFIIHELSRAFGLGGRSRRAGSIAERARLNVMRAVRSGMERISIADAALGAHLKATIHTGTVCVYTPILGHLSPGT